MSSLFSFRQYQHGFQPPAAPAGPRSSPVRGAQQQPWSVTRHYAACFSSRASLLLLLALVLLSSLLLLLSLSNSLYYGYQPALVFDGAGPDRAGRSGGGARAGDRSRCDAAAGEWRFDSTRQPVYDEECPFHKKGWNCLRNGRPGVERMYGWSWVAQGCNVSVIQPRLFLEAMRNKNIGFVGDSLNENLLVSLLCILRTADRAARKWKRKGAWRGAFFPGFNVTVGYHRAVLLAQYSEWQSTSSHAGVLERYGLVKGFRVDVDVPATDWINACNFYDVLVFNTGHWWGVDKFPPETPLIFFQGGEPLLPPLTMAEGLELVLRTMVGYVEENVPAGTLKLWRTQSPRHFDGGEWNKNGTCSSDLLLSSDQVEVWFRPENGGVNKEEREVNEIIRSRLIGTSFKVLDVAPMSEFRADAHPSLWLGKKDSYITWGQDCLHWCLPGVPDIWTDFLAAAILEHLELGSQL